MGVLVVCVQKRKLDLIGLGNGVVLDVGTSMEAN